ncbi:hypothetical protein ABT56_12435 [Photobacterium aquae]|uniref:Uncharacterized protein n=2 Tax=Photobacterium aquae TaxID=1195763 RepID=A0A0J1H038_9GAMM|nr:hypothetical protein ABT56_12435 [Photobacterium aquae]
MQYQLGVFSGKYSGGVYTDPVPEKKGYEFIIDGNEVWFDRDSNGHHEMAFLVEDNQLTYIACIGKVATIIDASYEYRSYLGKNKSALNKVFDKSI